MSPVVATNKLSVTTTLPKPGEYKQLEPDTEGVKWCVKPIGFMPIGDRIVVMDRFQKMTEGGLHIPDNATAKDNRGLLIAAGLKAMDILHDAGIELGSDVYWGSYAGVYNEFKDDNGKTYDLLQMRVEDILSSVSLYKLLSSGKWSIRLGQTDEGETQHFFHRKA